MVEYVRQDPVHPGPNCLRSAAVNWVLVHTAKAGVIPVEEFRFLAALLLLVSSPVQPQPAELLQLLKLPF